MDLNKAKGMFEDAKEKVGDLVDKHGDKVDGVIDKAAEQITKRTSGSTDAKVESVAEKAKDLLGNLGSDSDPDPAGGAER